MRISVDKQDAEYDIGHLAVFTFGTQAYQEVFKVRKQVEKITLGGTDLFLVLHAVRQSK